VRTASSGFCRVIDDDGDIRYQIELGLEDPVGSQAALPMEPLDEAEYLITVPNILLHAGELRSTSTSLVPAKSKDAIKSVKAGPVLEMSGSAPQVHPLPNLRHPPKRPEKKEHSMSEHHDAPKAHELHPRHEEHTKGPHDLKEINPKMASDIAYWSKEFAVTGDQLHECIRAHGTRVDKVRAALYPNKDL
jgi:hypothetical protein